MSEYENSKPLDDQESKTTLTTNTPIVDAEPKGTTEQNHYRASEVITPDLDGGFFQYVNSVLRANFFLRFSLQDHYRNWLNIFFMLLVSIVVQLVGDFSHVGATGKVSLYGFPGVLFFIPISFVSAIVVSAFGRRLSKTLALLSLLCGICVLHQLMYLLLIFFYKVELLSTFLPRWHRSFDFFRYLWLALACGFAAIRVLDLDRNIKRLLLGLLPQY